MPFFKFVYASIDEDQELLLYLGFYAFFTLLPLAFVFYYLSSSGNGPDGESIAFFGFGVLFYATAINRFFEFAVSHSIIERYYGRSANPVSCLGYLIKKSPLIFKITFVSFVWDLFALITRSILRKDFPGIVNWIATFFFSVVDVAKEVFMGFLVPIAILKDKNSLVELGKDTTQFLKNNLLESVRLNMKLFFISMLWGVIAIIAIVVLPELTSRSEIIKTSYVALILSAFLFRYLIALCTIILYTQTVVEIVKGGLSQEQIQANLKNRGVITGDS
ncbi:MAG: hypothetical protein KA715_13935 [Xanthomonadaceae bacterium]|nr:hypothetical protein [Xanthomonadaceae bacterium]